MRRMFPLRRLVRPFVPPALIDHYRRSRPTPLQVAKQLAPFSLSPRALDELYDAADVDAVQIPVSQVRRYDEWAVPAAELLTLAGLCAYARPRRVFEIGTYTGASTLVLAMNTPADTEIFTVDIHPDARATHRHGLGVGGFPEYPVGGDFAGHAAASKITQLYGNSLEMDLSAYEGTIDLVYVDADHTYEFVKADTATAFRLLRPGGTIVWDDYTWNDRHPECAGVTRTLNELSRTRPVYRLSGTRFGIYVDRP